MYLRKEKMKKRENRRAKQAGKNKQHRHQHFRNCETKGGK
jgi:hypothetical protein